MKRAIFYFDGFNFYYGLRDGGLHSCRWLDLPALADRLVDTDERVELVRYFTARIRNQPNKEKRQSTYLDALGTRANLEIDYGLYLPHTVSCHRCGNSWPKNEEKKTDVNVAVRLLDDAFDNRFDVAYIVSGDSDLVPPIESVKARFPEKRIVVASPPKREGYEIRQAADVAFRISDSKIRASRLEDPVSLASGTLLWAPRGWTRK